MKKAGEVGQKLKQVKFRHIKRELEKLLETKAVNCRFNYFLKPGTVNQNKLISLLGGGVHICKCPDLESRICDSRLEDVDGAASCPYFSLRHDKEKIKDSLKEFFKERSTAEISIRFPDVASLLWVLEDDDYEILAQEIDDLDEDEEE